MWPTIRLATRSVAVMLSLGLDGPSDIESLGEGMGAWPDKLSPGTFRLRKAAVEGAGRTVVELNQTGDREGFRHFIHDKAGRRRL